jgi:hypothetical protein
MISKVYFEEGTILESATLGAGGGLFVVGLFDLFFGTSGMTQSMVMMLFGLYVFNVTTSSIRNRWLTEALLEEEE